MKRIQILKTVISILLCLTMSAPALADVLTLPQMVEIIEEEAFFGDTSIDQVVLSDYVTEIRARAFASSTISEINLPDSLTFIAEDAFDNTNLQNVAATKGTYGWQWAVDHGYIKIPVTRIMLTPPEALNYTDKYNANTVIPTIRATVEPENATNPSLTWSIDQTSVLGFYNNDDDYADEDIDTGDELHGKFRYIMPRKVGTATITATANDGSGVQASITVQVTPKETAPFTYPLLDLSTNEHLEAGKILEHYLADGDIQLGWNIVTVRLLNQAEENHSKIYAFLLDEEPDFNDPTQINRRVGDILVDSYTTMRLALQAYINDSKIILEKDTLAQAKYLRVMIAGYANDEATEPGWWTNYAWKIIPEGTTEPNINDFEFEVNDDETTCTLTTYTGTDPDVVIPSRNAEGKTVTHIASHAFNDLSITSVTMPDTILGIGYSAFAGCTYLSEVILSNNLTSLKPYEGSGGIFKGCTSLTSIDIPASVTSIGSNAFDDCTNLTHVILHEGLTSIGSYAFDNCTNLGAVVLPRSIRSIGDYAFYNCGMTDITIPDSVTAIGSNAFLGCNNLTYVDIPDSVTSIGDYAFTDCDALVGIHLSSSLKSIGKYAFSSCDSLADIVIPNSVISFGNNTFENCNSLTSVLLSSGITSIPNYMFYNCESLSSITIPDSVTSIGTYAFDRCTALSTVDFPVNLKTIGNAAFRSCEALSSVTLPSGVTTIGNYVFAECSSMVSIYLPDTISTIGLNCFDSSGIVGIVWPAGTHTVANYMFKDCSSLTGVTLHNQVTGIGEYVFSGCSALTVVEIPSSMSSIGKNAFRESSISSMTIPSNIVSIGESAFRDCDQLSEIYIPASVKTLGTDAFYDCSLLPHVTLPDGLQSIPAYCFGNCENLSTVTISGTVRTIGDWAFVNCNSLKTLSIPSGVQSIGKQVFSSCEHFESIVIPSSVVSIGTGAFNYCQLLTVYGVPGTAAETTANAYDYVSFVAVNLSTGNDSQGLSLSGSVKTASGEGVENVVVVVSDEDSNQSGITTTSSNGEWHIGGLLSSMVYTVSYLTDSYIVSGVENATVGDEVSATATLNSEINNGITYSMRQNGQTINSAIVGTAIDFSVSSNAGTWVRLVVDGKAYEEYPLSNGSVSFSRAFSSAGSRSIQFEAYVDGTWAGISAAKTLDISSSGSLSAPVLNSIPNYVIGTQGGVTVSWNRVNHATSYTAYLYHKNTRLWPVSMNDTASTTTSSLRITIPSQYLTSSGTYNIQIVASGEGYSSATGFRDFTVSETSETIELLLPEQGNIIPFGDPFTVTVASSLMDAYFKVSCMDQNGSEVFVEANNSKKAMVVVNEPGDYTLKAIGIDVNGIYESAPVTVTVQEPGSITVLQTNEDEGNYSQYAYHMKGKTIHFRVVTDHTSTYIKIEDSASQAVSYTAKQMSNPHIWDFAVELKTAGLHEYTFTSQTGYQDIVSYSFPVYVLTQNNNSGKSMYVGSESGAVLYSRPDYPTNSMIPFETIVEIGSGLFGEYSLINYNDREYFVETSTLNMIPDGWNGFSSGQRSGITDISIQESSFSGMYAVSYDLAGLDDGIISKAYMKIGENPCHFAYVNDTITYQLTAKSDVESVNVLIRFLPATEYDMERRTVESSAWEQYDDICVNTGSLYSYVLHIEQQGLYELEFVPVSSTYSNVSTLKVDGTFGVRKTTQSTFYLKSKEELAVFASPCIYSWQNQYVSWETPLTVTGDAGNGCFLFRYGDNRYAFVEENEIYAQKNPVRKRAYIFISEMVHTQDGRKTSNEETKNKAEWLFLDAGCTEIKTYESATNSQLINALNQLASDTDFNDVSYVFIHTHGNVGMIGMSGTYGNTDTYGLIYFDGAGNNTLIKMLGRIQGNVHLFLCSCNSGSFITSASKENSGWDATRMTVVTSSEEDESTFTGLRAGSPLISVLYDQCRGDSKLDTNKNDQGISLSELEKVTYTTSNLVMVQHPQYYGSNLVVFYKR